MRIANGEIRGADLLWTGKDDLLQGIKSIFFCSLQMAYPRVLFVNTVFNNPIGALSVTALEDRATNSQNRALHICNPQDPDEGDLKWMAEKGVEPGEPSPDKGWVYIFGQTIDFSFMPVRIFGKGCSIEYHEPSLSKNLFSLDEWKRLEAIYQELGVPLKDDTMLAEVSRNGAGALTRAERRRLARGRV